MAADNRSISASTSLAINISLRNQSSSIGSSTAANMTAIDLISPPAAAPAPSPGNGLDNGILLITSPWKPTQAWVDRIEAEFPGLRVIYRDLQWNKRLAVGALSADDWRSVVVLLTTGFSLPTNLADVPRLRYVQLLSAGANHVLKTPLFTDTDIIFATANGVHGWVFPFLLSPPSPV